MRKLLIAMLAMAMATLAAVGVVGSNAYFTEQSVVDGEADAGNFVFTVEVGEENGGSYVQVPDNTFTVMAEDLYPGEWGATTYYFAPNNLISDNPVMKYRVGARKVLSDPDPAFWRNLTVKVETGFCDSSGPTITFPSTVYEGLLKDMYFDGQLNPQNAKCYRLAFGLDEAAGNELINGEATFDIITDATQASNPGWSETP